MKKPHPQEFNSLLTDETLNKVTQSVLEVSSLCEKSTNSSLDDASSRGYLLYVRINNNAINNTLFTDLGFSAKVRNKRTLLESNNQTFFFDASIRNNTLKKVYKILRDKPHQMAFDFGNDDVLCIGVFKLISAIDADSEAYVKFFGYNANAILITEWISTDYVVSLRTLDDDLPEPRNITSPSLEDLDKLNSEQDDDDLKTNDLNENG